MASVDLVKAKTMLHFLQSSGESGAVLRTSLCEAAEAAQNAGQDELASVLFKMAQNMRVEQ